MEKYNTQGEKSHSKEKNPLLSGGFNGLTASTNFTDAGANDENY